MKSLFHTLVVLKNPMLFEHSGPLPTKSSALPSLAAMLDKQTCQGADNDMAPKIILKRRREDNTLRHKEERRSDLWFDDGNVILETEKTQFRVHRGVLSRYSVAFREFPFPEHECPIIELADSAQDLRYLLDALYEWSFRSCTCLPLRMVLALMRLSQKYQIHKIREDLLIRLHEEWPTDYDVWISRSRPSYKVICGGSQRNITLHVLLAAQECGFKSLLPALYLSAFSLFSLDEIEDGFTTTDGDKIGLPMEERLRLIVGLIRLRDALLARARLTLNGIPASACFYLAKGDQRCPQAKSEVYSQEFKPDSSLMGFRPQLHPLSQDLSVKFCVTSCQSAVEDFNERRRELWDLLPSLFKLPDWKILKGDCKGE